MKFKKLINKSLTGLMLASFGVTSVVMPILSVPQTVYAEETDTEDTEEEPEARGNVNNISNPALKGRYKENSKYDFSTQYAVTYNYLMGGYLSNGEYAQLYSGVENGNGAFQTSVGKQLKQKPIIGQLQDVTDNDIESDTSQEDITTEGQVSSKSEIAELNLKVSKALAEDIVKDVIKGFKSPVVAHLKRQNKGPLNGAQKTSIAIDDLDIGNDNTYHESKRVQNALKRSLQQYIYLKLSSLTVTTTGTDKEIGDNIKASIKTSIGYNNISNVISGNTDSRNMYNYTYVANPKVPNFGEGTYSQRSNVSLVEDYSFRNVYTSENIKGNGEDFDKEIYNFFFSSNGQMTLDVKSVSPSTILAKDGNGLLSPKPDKKTEDISNTKLSELFSILPYNTTTKKDKAAAYASTVFKKVDNSKLGGSTWESYGKTYKKSAEEVQNISGRFIAYTPLLVYNDNSYEGIDPKSYAKELKKQGDILTSQEDGVQGINDSSNNARALQVRDLYVATQIGDSSKLMLGKNKKSRGYPIVESEDSSLSSDSSLRQYLGVKYSGDDRLKMGKEEFNKMETSQSHFMNSGNGLHKAITASGTFGNSTVTSQISALAMDNYGNIIVTESGNIVLPYWQNGFFTSGMRKSLVSASTVFKQTQPNDDYISNAIGTNTSIYNIKKVKEKAIKNLNATGYKGKFESTNTVESEIKKLPDSDTALREMIYKKSNDTEFMGTLAMTIALATAKESKELNDLFIKSVEGGSGFYVYPTQTGYLSQEEYEETVLSRWNASSIIQKIGQLFDYGVYEIFRLSFSQMISNLYDSIVVWVGNIFYNDNVTTSDTWSEVIFALSGFLLAFLIVFISIMALQIFRQVVTFKQVALKVLFTLGIIIIPAFGYNQATQWIINEPSKFVLDSAVKQGLVVNFLEDKQANKVMANEELQLAYDELFGSQTANKDYTNKNFILTFYTKTTKDGKNVDDIQKVENKENNWFARDTRNLNTINNQYNKRKLVSVNASIFDLYTWSTYKYYGTYGKVGATDGEGVDYTQYKNMSFFEYLSSTYGEQYEGLDSYSEYVIDMSDIYDSDSNLSKIYSDTKNTSGLAKITASQLFYELQKNSLADKNNSNLSMGLKSLAQLVKVFNIDYNHTPQDGYYIPTTSDIDTFIRDLSMTSQSRKTAYGSSGSASFSDFTKSVYGVSKKFNLPPEVIQTNMPKEDFFGVYTTITNLMSAQANSKQNIKFDNAMKSTYKVGMDTLSTVARKYSNVDQILNTTLDNTDTNSALQMSVLLELYFNLNKELGLKNFPTDYKPESVSFDSYLKMIFIPLKDYQFQNYTVSDLVVVNLMQYLSLRENPVVLTAVFICILMLMVFWLFYVAVFYVVLLFIVVIKFVKEYVIGSNYSNKSWLGVFFIYMTLGAVRLGLASIWWICYTILNSTYSAYGGLTYNPAGLHSIAIIAYLVFASKLVLIPLLKGVIEDHDNLGANFFTSKIDSVKGKLGSMGSNKGARITGTKSGTGARKLKDKLKGALSPLGKISDRVKKGGQGGKSGNKSKHLSKDAGFIKNKLRQGSKAISKIPFVSKANEALSQITYKNLSQEEKLNAQSKGRISNTAQMIKGFKTDSKVKAMRKHATKGVSFGDIVNTANTAASLGTTMLEMSNLPQTLLAEKGAEIVAHLASQGTIASIGSKLVDGEVVKTLNIDTTSVDMDDKYGRMSAVMGVQNYLKEEIVNGSRSFVSGNVSDLEDFDTEKPLFTKAQDGSFMVNSTSSHGVSYETFRDVFEHGTAQISGKSDAIEDLKDKYLFEKVQWVGEDGETKVNNSQYRLVPKQGVKLSNEDLKKDMLEFKAIDKIFRSRNNRDLVREDAIEDMAFEYLDFTPEELPLVEEFISKAHGVSLVEGNKLVYDPKLKSSRKEVKGFVNLLDSKNEELYKSYNSVDNDLNAFASKGSGYGTIDTQVLNSKEHSAQIDKTFGANYASNHSYVVAMDKTNDDNSRKLHNSLVLASASSKLGFSDVAFNEAIVNKEESRGLLKADIGKILSNKPYEIGNSLSFINENDKVLASSAMFLNLEKEYNKLQTDLAQGNISQEKFQNIMPYYAMQTNDLLESSSLLEGFANKTSFEEYSSLGIMSNQRKNDEIGVITSSKETIKDKLQLSDIKDVDRNKIDMEYVEKSKTVFGQHGSVEANALNNTVTVKTDNALEKSDGNLSDMFLGNSYNEALTSKVTNNSPLIDSLVNKYSDVGDFAENKVKKEVNETKESKDSGKKPTLDDILESNKKKQKIDKYVSPEPLNNISKTYDARVEKTNKSVSNLEDLLRDLSKNDKLKDSDLAKHQELVLRKGKITTKTDMSQIVENNAEMIANINELETLEKDIKDFINSRKE